MMVARVDGSSHHGNLLVGPGVNPPVPCIHADPMLPDCPPGETTRAEGWISFFEGENWLEEIKRIEETRWWETPVD